MAFCLGRSLHGPENSKLENKSKAFPWIYQMINFQKYTFLKKSKNKNPPVDILCWQKIAILMEGRTNLWPVIAGCITEHISLGVETAGSQRLVKSFRRLQFGSSILVPETKFAVRTHSGQGTMNRMECNVIHLCVWKTFIIPKPFNNFQFMNKSKEVQFNSFHG